MKNRKSQKKRSQPVCPEIKDQQIHQLVFQGKFPARRNLPCLIRINILKKKFSPPVQSADLDRLITGAYGQQVCTGSASWQIRSGIFRPLLRGMGLWCIIRR